MDGLRASINEIISVFIYTILLTYIASYLIGTTYDIAYITVLIMPSFILFAPFITNQQPKGLLEIIVKFPAYLFISFFTFIISYFNFTEEGVVLSTTTLYIFIVITLVYFIRTLMKFSKPIKYKAYEDRKYPSSLWISLMIGLFSVTVVLEGIIGFSALEGIFESFTTMIGMILFGILGALSLSYFFVTFLAGKK